ncbi:hypothetical protein EV190_102175 [Actinorugispora endophytica]|uniref:Uncharacterized protein n=1 Tax=Actinorugispora endophytica TaxID=1605990 RepID=A0A4R6V5U5_9ACTN|nr:hypothetical protein EV190_102175 [Actinorugispora endophytica]
MGAGRRAGAAGLYERAVPTPRPRSSMGVFTFGTVPLPASPDSARR